MAAILEPIISRQDALPVCLCRENLYGLVSLWDIVLRIQAHSFSELSFALGQVHQITKALPSSGDGPSPATIQTLNHYMDVVKENCSDLNLKLSLAHMETLRVLLAKSLDDALNGSGEGWPYVNRHVFELNGRIRDELRYTFVFAVSGGSERFFEPELFGEDVAAKFSDASFDISEAGKCLALGRYTACVFHLMRVLELGLQSLSVELGVSYDRGNWGVIIRDIDTTIKGMERDAKWTARPDWRERREAYAQAAGQFSVFRDAWRNHVAHNRRSYTEEQAKDVMGAVKAFMVSLSVWLEQPV